MIVICGSASPEAVKPGKVTVYWPVPVLITVGVLPRRLIAAVRCPSAATWTPPTETAPAMSEALLPSTWSAFRPVATPVAFVVNGFAFELAVLPSPTEIRPTTSPSPANSNAKPAARFDARRQGADPDVVPPAAPRPRPVRRAARPAAAAVDRAAAGLRAGLRVRLARHVAALGARRRIELADDLGLFARRAVAHFGADRVARGHRRGVGAHPVTRLCSRQRDRREDQQ